MDEKLQIDIKEKLKNIEYMIDQKEKKEKINLEIKKLNKMLEDYLKNI